MKTNLLIFSLSAVLWLTACGGGGNTLDAKKQALREKQAQFEKLQSEIKGLEKEIAQLDPAFAKQLNRATLITTITAGSDKFTGYIEVQASVKSDNNIILTAETSGIVRALNVSEGQAVGAGQVLVMQDSEILQKNIAEVKTSLELADLTFKRQENLWNQKIGTELQYLQAKNQKEGLEKRLQTLAAQTRQANVIAPFSGIVDEIFIKRGQMAMPGSQLIRLVSANQVKVIADVSETYLSKIKRGDKVTVSFPSLETEREANISVIGATINPDNRTFRIEILMANPDNSLKPDLLAKVRLKNYEKASAITVPTNLIQKDKSGEYVFIISKEKDKTLAKLVRVKTGDTFKNRTEILEGLKGDEILVDEGFREVTDGGAVKIQASEKAITANNK